MEKARKILGTIEMRGEGWSKRAGIVLGVAVSALFVLVNYFRDVPQPLFDEVAGPAVGFVGGVLIGRPLGRMLCYSLFGRALHAAGAVASVAVSVSAVAVAAAAQAAAPRITLQRQFTYLGLDTVTRPSSPAFVYVQWRSCVDAAGPIRVIVRESKRINSHVLASSGRAVTKRQRAGCQNQWLRWWLAPRFYGVGWYVINIRIRDARGRLSNPIGRAWLTTG